MARKIYYRIPDDRTNRIADREWEEVLRLQHWYNSEFFWTAGKLSFKMFAVFQAVAGDHISAEEWQKKIRERMDLLRGEGMSENEMIRILEQEGLVSVKKGGYADGCLASGFTRVAGNEFNAYLVLEFLLKASHLLKGSFIEVEDEGEFIKAKYGRIEGGSVTLTSESGLQDAIFGAMAGQRRVFSIVDAQKYSQYPKFRSDIPDFSALSADERSDILTQWNWLGFESSYDINGDDLQGLNLNLKVKEFRLVKFEDRKNI